MHVKYEQKVAGGALTGAPGPQSVYPHGFAGAPHNPWGWTGGCGPTAGAGAATLGALDGVASGTRAAARSAKACAYWALPGSKAGRSLGAKPTSPFHRIVYQAPTLGAAHSIVQPGPLQQVKCS